MARKLMIDFYSGLGGASNPFKSAGWDVLQFDNNPIVLPTQPDTILCDLGSRNALETILSAVDGREVELLWASPPCTYFSTANPKRDVERAMRLVRITFNLISEINPRYHVVENVHGSIKPISKEFGSVRQIVGRPFHGAGGFALWGNFPLLDLPHGWVHLKDTHKLSGDNPLRPWLRSIVPPEIGEALMRAMATQTRLDDFDDLVSKRTMS